MNSNVGLLVCTHRVCLGQRLLRYIYIYRYAAFYIPILYTIIIYNIYGKKPLNRLLIFLCGGGGGLLNVFEFEKRFFIFIYYFHSWPKSYNIAGYIIRKYYARTYRYNIITIFLRVFTVCRK